MEKDFLKGAVFTLACVGVVAAAKRRVIIKKQ